MGSVAAGKRKWAAKGAYPTAVDMLILTGLRLFKIPLPWIDGVGRSGQTKVGSQTCVSYRSGYNHYARA